MWLVSCVPELSLSSTNKLLKVGSCTRHISTAVPTDGLYKRGKASFTRICIVRLFCIFADG